MIGIRTLCILKKNLKRGGGEVKQLDYYNYSYECENFYVEAKREYYELTTSQLCGDTCFATGYEEYVYSIINGKKYSITPISDIIPFAKSTILKTLISAYCKRRM